jgi:hypothetical protein
VYQPAPSGLPSNTDQQMINAAEEHRPTWAAASTSPRPMPSHRQGDPVDPDTRSRRSTACSCRPRSGVV